MADDKDTRDTFAKGARQAGPRPQMRAGQQNVMQAQFARTIWHYKAAPGVELADTLVSDFWHGLWRGFHAGDHIEILAIDRYHATLLVLDAGASHVSVTPLQVVQLEPTHKPESDLPLGWSVSFCGPETLWSVFRGTALAQSGFATKSLARQWLNVSGRALA